MRLRSIFVSGLILAAGLIVACAPDRDRTGAADRARQEADRADRAMSDRTAPAETADRSDTGITASVKAKLAADQSLSTLTDMSVETEEGVVRLKGEVPTAAHKSQAEQLAKSVDGVKTVINDLKIVRTR